MLVPGCSRRRPDALLQAMVAQYGFVPVMPPASSISIGSVLAFHGSDCCGRFGPAEVFGGEALFPDAEDTPMRQFLDDFSGRIALDGGFTLLGAWLGAVGLGSVSAKLRAQAANSGATSMSLSVQQGRIRRVSPLALGAWMAGSTLLPDAAGMLEGNRLYAIHSTWHASKIRLRFRRDSRGSVKLDAKAIEGVGAGLDVSVRADDADKVSIDAGKGSVCFAVDACRLAIDPAAGSARLELRERPPGISRGEGGYGADAPLEPLVDEDWGDDAFLPIGDRRQASRI